MPILLDKPFSVGDLDPDAGEGYEFCQLTNLYHQGVTMAVTVEYQFGTATGDYYEHWTRGAGSPTRTVDVAPSDVVALWGQKPQEGESVGQAMRRLTYEYLIDRGYVKGTIVDAPPLPPAQTTATAGTDANAAVADAAATDSAPADAPAADSAPADSTEAPAASTDPAAS